MKILVTGASRGIGNYLSELLFNDGHNNIYGAARNAIVPPNWNNFALFSKGDLTRESEVYELANCISDIDSLVLCHGISSMNHLFFTTAQKTKEIFDTNFFSQFQLIKTFARHLKRSSNASIVCFSSVAVPFSLEGESAYVASKAALEALVKVASKELASFNIRINAIGPGPVETFLIKNVPKEKIDKILKRQAFKKFTGRKDIFNLVKFLISEESKMITGQTIYLGGV